MADYGCDHLVVDLEGNSNLRDFFDTLIESAEDDGFRARLAASAAVERSKSERMWAEVSALLRP